MPQPYFLGSNNTSQVIIDLTLEYSNWTYITYTIDDKFELSSVIPSGIGIERWPERVKNPVFIYYSNILNILISILSMRV
jgi:hypothetical protein